MQRFAKRFRPAANEKPSAAYQQQVELQSVEIACLTIADPSADEAALRAAFLSIGSAIHTEKERNNALSAEVDRLSAIVARLEGKE